MVANKKKYVWAPDMPLPLIEEHSTVKHSITSEYIKRYIYTLLSGFNWDNLKISLVDGFAGGGRYEDVLTGGIVPGSPFLIMDSVREAEAYLATKFEKPKKVNADFYFIESNLSSFDFLQNEIKNSEWNEQLGKNLFLFRSRFDQAADQIIQRIKNRNKAQRCLFILDQYAYKDVPFQYIYKIIRELNNSEVILTFGFQSLQSFLSDNQNSRAAMRNIGLEKYIDWDRLEELKRNGLWHHLIQEQLSEAIKKASGASQMTLFFIEPKKGWSYWLVHLSKQYKARSVMMDIHWNTANKINARFQHVIGDGIFGLGYKASKTPGQSTFDFDEVMEFDDEGQIRCVNALTKDLSKFVYNNQPITYENLLARIGSLTAATESSIQKALQNGMDTQEIKATNIATGKLRRSATQIDKSDILKVPQKTLFDFFGN